MLGLSYFLYEGNSWIHIDVKQTFFTLPGHPNNSEIKRQSIHFICKIMNFAKKVLVFAMLYVIKNTNLMQYTVISKKIT